MAGRDGFDKYRIVIRILERAIPLRIKRLFCALTWSSETKGALLSRYIYYRSILSSCGDAVFFGGALTVKNGQSIRVGDNVSIHAYCYLDGAGGISIGSHVSIAHQCSLISFEHTWSDASNPIKYNPVRLSSITIEDDVWIGCGVRVLAGAYIERRTVVAAGAVVKGRLKSGYVYAGVPAKPIKKI